MKKIIVLTAFAVLNVLVGYTQITTTTLYSSEDSYTSTASASSNYGTLGTIEVSKTSTSVFRSFLKFDVSSIPANAVITSAILRLTPSGSEGILSTDSTRLYLDVCNSTWTETGITSNSGISNNTLFSTVTASYLVSSKREFQVKNHLQAMIEGRLLNYGWRIRRNDESTVASTAYYTRENGTIGNRPQLEVKYYIRSSVSAAAIVHTSTLTSTDGSISPTVINGSNTTKTYRWYNSSGTQIATTQNLSGVGKGWYGLKYFGTSSGDTTYQAFIVGTECEEISITFDPGPNYMDDARLRNLIEGTGTTVVDYNSVNYGDLNVETAQRSVATNWYSDKTVMKFRLWIDPNCQVNTANLALTGNSQNTSGATNASEFALNTSNWYESGVSFRNAPTSTATGKISIASIPTGNSNLTVNIASFFNTWKANNTANYGFVFQLQSYTSDLLRRMQFNSSDATTASLRPQITFSIKVNSCDLSRKGTASVTYDASNTYGDATVTITPPSWAVGPYHYLISEQEIPEFDVIYKTLRDSVFGGTLDSTKFYYGDDSNLTKQFLGLYQGGYYISAFDKLGKRVYSDLISVSPMNYESSSGITFANDVFTTTAANGKALISSYMTELSETGTALNYIVQLNTGEAFFGLMNTSGNLNVKTDILHGFHVQSGSARVIINGVIGSTSYTVTTSDELRVFKDGSVLRFYIAGVERGSYTLPASFTYKNGVFASISGSKIKVKPIRLLNLNWVINRLNPIVPGSCLGSFGKISGTLYPIILTTKTPTNFNAVLTNSGGTAQTLDAGSTMSNYSFSNLLPGNYTLTVSFNWMNTTTSAIDPNAVTYVYNLVVASKIAWEGKVNTIDVAASSSLLGTSGASSGWGHANSVNEALVAASNFVDFGVNVASTFVLNLNSGFFPIITIQNGIAVIGFGDPATTPLPTTLPSNFTGYYMVKTMFLPYILMRYEGGIASGTVTTFLASDKFRMVCNTSLSANQVSLYKYTATNVLGAQIPNTTMSYTPATIKKLIAYVKNANGKGFINMSTNMACPASIIYAKLERSLKGVKYAVSLNKFYFYYDEEYASSASLTYKVYDKNNNVVLSTSSQVLTQMVGSVNREYGDNRYSLDVTSLGSGAYVLEVVNERGEKFYLRFVK